MATGSFMSHNYSSSQKLVAITPNPNNGTRGSLHSLLRNPIRPLQDEEEPQPPSKGVAKTHKPGATHCPCQWFIDPKVNAEEVQALHIPFGVPYSAQGNNSLLLLHNADYVVAYSTSLRVAEWVGFALTSKYQSLNRSSPESEICWTDDARVPSDALIKCTDYNWTHVEGQHFSQRPFYHPDMLNSTEGAQSTFVTNSVPKSFPHLPLEESMTQILDEWTSRGKALHVFTGPAFDFLGTGLRPDLEAFQHRNESLLIPTHLFYVITWCRDEVENIVDCEPRDLRVCSFLLPNWPFSMNSWDVEGIVLDVIGVSGTGLASAGKGENIDPVDEGVLLESDATEMYRLLDVVGEVSIKGIGE
ncbi:venom phosphodiesterase 2 [Trichonephila clavipes]|nr:venom phosphodiesterase 2 [Trichonephila clavipes]